MKTLEEINNDKRIWDVKYDAVFGLHSAKVHLPDCKTCTVIFNSNEDGYEHVSVSPLHKYNIPSWEDMCILNDMFFNDEEESYQIMPKKSEYVNIVNNCLHLFRPANGRMLDELRKEK